MSKEQFYARKPFIMVESAQKLIRPYEPLSCADRDFLTFELSFFYYFVYDYKIFSQLDNELRERILNVFLEKIQSSRPNDFPDLKAIDRLYEVRIFTFYTITKKTESMGEFSEKCADYINTLLSYSEKNNVYTCHSFDQAEKELKPNIEANKYTDELKMLLTVSSSSMMIDRVDPTESGKGI